MIDRDKERMPTAIIYYLLTDCILIAPATAFVGLFQKKKENLAFGIRIKFWLHIQMLCVTFCKFFHSFKSYLLIDFHKPGAVLGVGGIIVP